MTQGSEPLQARRPRPLALGTAIDAMAGGAAPLLAGFAVASIGLVVGAGAAIAWPGAALSALSLSAVLLIAAVQFGFHARSYLYSAGELKDWAPHLFDGVSGDIVQSTPPSPLQEVISGQRADFERWLWWSARSRWLYNLGIVMLGVATTITLVPVAGDDQSHLRWMAVAIVAIATLAEIVWIMWRPRR